MAVMTWKRFLCLLALGLPLTAQLALAVPSPKDDGVFTAVVTGTRVVLQAGPDSTTYVLTDSSATSSASRYLELIALDRISHAPRSGSPQLMATSLPSGTVAAAFSGKPAVLADSLVLIGLNTQVSSPSGQWVARLWARSLAGGLQTLQSWANAKMIGVASFGGRYWCVTQSQSGGAATVYGFGANGSTLFSYVVPFPVGAARVDPLDIVASPDNSIVFTYGTNAGGCYMRRLSATGDSLGYRANPAGAGNTVNSLVSDESGATYGSVNSGSIAVFDYALTNVGYFSGGGGLTALSNPIYGQDLDCKLYTIQPEGGIGLASRPVHRTATTHTITVRRVAFDNDGDGICDCWERFGLRSAGSASAFMIPGVDTIRKDVYLEVAAMVGRTLPDSTCDTLSRAFRRIPRAQLPTPLPAEIQGGIVLHINRNASMQSLPSRGWGNFGMSDTTAVRVVRQEFVAAKNAAIQASGDPVGLARAKALYSRYLISVVTLPGVKHSGDSEITRPTASTVDGGNDIAVALNEAGYNGTLSDTTKAYTPLEQAGIVMHEIGHTLGLGHGGADDVNFKPNYRGVMNYEWMVPSLASAVRRNEWRLRYSTYAYSTVDENHISELVGLPGRGARAREHALVGPPRPRNGDCVPDIVPIGLANVDLNGNHSKNQVNIPINLTNYDAISGVPDCDPDLGDPFEQLASQVDAPHLLLLSRYWNNWKQDGVLAQLAAGGGHDVPGIVGGLRYAKPFDCNGNGTQDSLEIAQGAPDLDGDGYLDACDGSRLIEVLTHSAPCPAGDGDSLRFRVALDAMPVS